MTRRFTPRLTAAVSALAVGGWLAAGTLAAQDKQPKPENKNPAPAAAAPKAAAPANNPAPSAPQAPRPSAERLAARRRHHVRRPQRQIARHKRNRNNRRSVLRRPHRLLRPTMARRRPPTPPAIVRANRPRKHARAPKKPLAMPVMQHAKPRTTRRMLHKVHETRLEIPATTRPMLAKIVMPIGPKIEMRIAIATPIVRSALMPIVQKMVRPVMNRNELSRLTTIAIAATVITRRPSRRSA
jgi:hypothetical protein